MIYVSFYITLLLLSLNQFTSLSKEGGFNIYGFDIGVGIFVVLGIMFFMLAKRSFRLPRYSYLFIIFVLLAFSSLVLASTGLDSNQIIVSAFYLARYFVYLLAGIVVYNIIDKKIISKKTLTDAFIFSGLFLAVGGFVQILLLPDFTVLEPELGWDPHKNRLASTFFDPNFLGAYFVLCLILLLERFYPGKRSDKNKVISDSTKKFEHFSFIILTVALILTFSRSAWGMFGIAVFIYGIFRSKKLLLGAILVVFMAYFAVPRIQTRISGVTDPADSAAFRLVSWGNTVKIIEDNFWPGVGFNSFRYAQRDYGFLTPDEEDAHSGAGSDSSLLFVFATTGLLGFFVYLLALLFPSYEALVGKENSWLVVFTSVASLLLESQFINSLFYPQIMFFMFFIIFSYLSRT